MVNSETGVMFFFNVGAVAGFCFIFSGVVRNVDPNQLTPNITASFLMSITGICIRILAKPAAFPSEKLVISAAVITYTVALFCDYYAEPALAVNLKLITTGCVGLWNALQMIRIKSSQTEVATNTEALVAKAALGCYSLGAMMGYSSFLAGLIINAPTEQLAPFITFTFLMSHCGNLVRTEFNLDARSLETNYIRAAVLTYCIALCCDFIHEHEAETIAAYTKLTAAGCVGLWNTAQTWRLNPEIYGCSSRSRSVVPQQHMNQSNRGRDLYRFFGYQEEKKSEEEGELELRADTQTYGTYNT